MIIEVGIYFDVMEGVLKSPIVQSEVTRHLVWDMKMDLTREIMWVLDGHNNPDPIFYTHAGVLSM